MGAQNTAYLAKLPSTLEVFSKTSLRVGTVLFLFFGLIIIIISSMARYYGAIYFVISTIIFLSVSIGGISAWFYARWMRLTPSLVLENQAEGEEIKLITPTATSGSLMGQVGGYLYVTNKRISFRPHKYHFHDRKLDIMFDDILGIQGYNAYFVVPIGIRILLNSGSIQSFKVVDNKYIINEMRTELGANKKIFG